MKISKGAILLVGAIEVAATIAIVLLLQREPYSLADWVGIGFLLFAEVVGCLGIIIINQLAKSSARIITVSVGNVLISCYSITVFITSLIFILLPTEDTSIFLVVQICLLALALIALVISYAFSRVARSAEIEDNSKTAMINNTLSQLNYLKGHPVYGAKIGELYKKLSSCDLKVTRSADSTIAGAVNNLGNVVSNQNADAEQVENLCATIDSLINGRIKDDRVLK